MFPTLPQLIGEKAFEGGRKTLEKRCRSAGISCVVQYGAAPPNSSLCVRFKSEERVGEIRAWESGDCEVRMMALQKPAESKPHYVHLRSGQDFYGWLAKAFRHAANRKLEVEA